MVMSKKSNAAKRKALAKRKARTGAQASAKELAALLKKYMTKGQYIVITHNDEIIGQATNLYGISMHDGVSKIVSLKL